MTFDQVVAAYREHVRGLVDGGADLLLLETIFDTLNAKAAIAAILDVFEEKGVQLPLMISVTITDRSGRTLSGQMLDAFYMSIRHARPFSVGLNCALGAREMRPYLAELARIAETYVTCYPNAGLPNAFGQYDELPDETAALLRDFAESGFVNIVGGCCGTTPDHIRAIAGDRADPAASPADRDPRIPHSFTQLSGLETLTIRPDSNFIMIGERTNVTGSKRFARLVTSGDFGEAAHVALDQVRGGANILDVNMDEGMLDSEAAMTTFLNLIATEPEIARVPIMVDSSKWTVLEAGLKCVQGKGVVNSISLKEGEEDFLRKARTVRRYGAAVVVMAFDEQGQADTVARKVAICQRAYALLTETGRLRSARHHLRSEHPRDRDRPRGAQRVRDQLHRGDAGSSRRPVPGSRSAAASATCRSRSAATTSSARRCIRPSSSTPSRPASTWASSMPASWSSTRTFPKESARARRGRDLQPPAGRHRTPRAVRRNRQG